MNIVTASFDHETVKKAIKLHYQGTEDFGKWDQMPDGENCLFYLDLFSKMLKKYGVDDNSVMLKKDESLCRSQEQK